MPSILNKRGRKRAARWFVEFVLFSILLWVVFVLVGRVLPQIALGELSELTDTKISAEAVDFRFDGSVYIKEFVVQPHRSAGYDNSILKARTVRVRFGIGSLIRFRPRLREIFVDDFVLRAQYDTNTEEWNLSALKIEMPQAARGRLPLIWLENGEIEYSKVVEGRVRVVARSPVSAGFRPAEKILGGYSFDISGAGRQSFGGSAVFGYWQPGRIVVGGRISSRDVPGFERPWTVKALDAEMSYEPNQSYTLMAKAKGFTCPPSELRNLFAFDTRAFVEKASFVDAIQVFFNRYNPSGRVDIDLRVSGNLASLSESTIAGKIYCSDAVVCDRDFAYTVEHITGQVDLTEKSARLKGLTGRHGGAELAFEGWAAASGADWKYDLQITGDNMALDQDLYNALTRKEQKLWSAFSPSGMVAIRYSRSQTSPRDIKSVLAVQLLNVEGKYAGFDYPLKNASGMLYFTADDIEFSDVVSQWGGRRITVNGRVGLGEGEQPGYDFSVRGENVPLDATLEEALPAAQREFYNRFEMAGRFDATIKVFSREGGKGVETFTAEVYPRNSSLKAKVLPMVVNDVTGKVVVNPEVVDIENLTGRYEDGTVALSGRVWPRVEPSAQTAGGQTEIGYCLSMRAKQVELGEELVGTLPGSLGAMVGELRPGGEVNLTADVSRNVQGRCGADRVIIECLGSTIDCNLLPYPLRDISGKIVITQSQIELDNVTARALYRIRGEAAQSVMKATGRIVFGGGGTGEGMQITAGDVNFSGQNVRLKGKTLSRVDTVLEYDTQLGQWLSRHFVADFYDGKMIGKLQIDRSSDGGLDYLLEASVAGADLEQFLSDTEGEGRPEEHYSTGSINGSLSIVGSVVDNSIRLGRCRLKIIDMEAGKLSPLAKLLTVLKLTEQSDYAFDEMTVDAYIQDNKVFFRKIDLSGKSLAFYGSGWLDLKTDDINLTLTARGRRLATARPSVLQSLTEGLGRAVVRIEVSGKAGNPDVTTKTLPVIGETLEIFGTPRDR